MQKFVKLAEQTSNNDELMKSSFKLVDQFKDGPPLRVHNDGWIPEGGRKSSLFNVGVYFRKKNPDDWQEDLMKFNYEHVDEPLPSVIYTNGLIKAKS